MALPKEPRQKMINIMYLVLTALLALNVSAEILNAFKVVTKSMDRSNSNLTASSEEIYASFTAAMTDPKNRDKAVILKPKADSIKAETDNLLKIINQYRSEIITEAIPSEGGGVKKEDNLDIGTHVMEKGGGEAIFNAIKNYQQNVERILGKSFVAVFPKGTPLFDSSVTDSKSLVTKQFRMQPVLANLTMFSKVINDAKNTESQSIKYLFSQMDAVVVRLNKFEPLVSLSSSYLMPGEEMTVQAGMGAFNDEVKPTISINGSGISTGPNGVAETKFKVNNSGSVNVVINFKDPNTGEPRSINKSIPYTIGVPGGSAIMLDKMNAFYIGLENPITIGSPKGWDKTNVSPSGCTLSGSNAKRTVTVTTPGTASITVSAEGSPPTTYQFRVLRVPDPVFKIGDGKPRQPTVSLKNQQFVRAELENFVYDTKFSIVKATVYFSGAGFASTQIGTINGNGLGGISALLQRCQPGSSITFDAVTVSGPGGTRVIDGRTFTCY